MIKKGYAYGILSAVLFGSAGLFVKLAQSELDSVNILILQYIMATILMFLVLSLKDKSLLKISKSELKDLAILGVVGNTFMTTFYYLAFNYLPVAMTTILLMTYPIMVFAYSVLVGKQKLKVINVVNVLLAFIGCLMTLSITKRNFNYSVLGIFYGVLAAVFYAFMNVFSENRFRDIHPLAINAYSTLFSLISLMVYRFPKFLFRQELTLHVYMYSLILAIFCEVIPLTLLYAAIKYIGALKVSIISNLEIPTSILISLIILNESISIIQFVGIGIVVYSVYLIEKTQ
jgi:drug/metabolite transporter (DMT)-like permease